MKLPENPAGGIKQWWRQLLVVAWLIATLAIYLRLQLARILELYGGR